MASYQQANSFDVEGGHESILNKRGNMGFAEKHIRQGFIRKVFGLLATQLVITVAIASIIFCSSSVRNYIQLNSWVLGVTALLSIGLVLAMALSETLRRKHPHNLVTLFAFTACEGLLLGVATSKYDAQVVMVAAAITCGVAISLALFAMQTKYDFTVQHGIMWSVLMTLMFAGLVGAIVRAPMFQVMLSAGGAVVFSCYMVIDLQLVMGGGKYNISPDEYVFASLNIYLDLINLFLYILRIVAEAQRK